jgi:hypothetical protein
MSYFAQELGELFVYIAYLGVGGAGKGTNVLALRERTDPAHAGRIISVYDADHDFRKDMWDFRNPTAHVRGVPVRFHVWWRSGLHFDLNAEEYLLGGGLDGAVLVVDSQQDRLEANQQYCSDIQHLISESFWPYVVLQYNKRDVPGAAPIRTLDEALNPRGLDTFEAVASRGVGVVETLDSVTSRVLSTLRR